MDPIVREAREPASALMVSVVPVRPSAETRNSENGGVLREMPDVARRYVAHWQSRWDQGTPYPGP